jgi:hypothetical protein
VFTAFEPDAGLTQESDDAAAVRKRPASASVTNIFAMQDPLYSSTPTCLDPIPRSTVNSLLLHVRTLPIAIANRATSANVTTTCTGRAPHAGTMIDIDTNVAGRAHRKRSL